MARAMDVVDLRIALFSGNYNYVKDGANQALNRLAEYLLRQGAKLRVYSPTTDTPAFAPTGDLVAAPSVPIPSRSEYQFPLGLSRDLKRDLEAFKPNIVHISSPDMLGRGATAWARAHGVPVLCSVHTRFETYLQYYKLGWLEPGMVAFLRRLYQRCDALVAPSESFADILRAQGMNEDIAIWSRGVDRELFNPARRDLAWRRGLGIADDDMTIGFLGRLVMEKGLDVFADTVDTLRKRGVAHKVLVIGEGPARGWFEERLPGGVFVGFQQGPDLARAVASMDVLFNPSVTEAFGNVTLEAMACRVPVVAAVATGALNLVHDGQTGRLIAPGDIASFAEAIAAYQGDPAMRAAHGSAGEQAAQAYSWDAINKVVADTYLRLIVRRQQA